MQSLSTDFVLRTNYNYVFSYQSIFYGLYLYNQAANKDAILFHGLRFYGLYLYNQATNKDAIPFYGLRFYGLYLYNQAANKDAILLGHFALSTFSIILPIQTQLTYDSDLQIF